MAGTTIDPFKSVTIPGECNLVYQKTSLKPNTIAIIPPNVYRARDKQSIISTKWLLWLENEENINIQMAHNGREAKVGPFKLDGLHVSEDGIKTAFEFQGCW